jgi:hypothetical protein
MKINVHIERLVLEGLAVRSHDSPRVNSALTRELERLIGAHGAFSALRSGGAVPALRADTLRMERCGSPVRLGTEIARAVHGGLTKQR